MSIKSRLRIIIALSVGFAFLVAGAAVLLYEARTFQPRALERARSQAQVAAEILVPAILFKDSASAAAYLATLGHWEEIEAASVYDAEGDYFAGWRRGGGPATGLPGRAPTHGHVFHMRHLKISAPVLRAGREVVGTVWLSESLLPLYARLPQYGIMFGVLALSLLALAFMLAVALKHGVSAPITSLSGTAQSVIEKQDYSLRAQARGKDEIGNLTRVFNQMLETVEQRDRSLRQSEQRFSKAFHASPMPMSILRIEDGVFIDANESILKMLGYSREEVIGRTSLDLGIIPAAERDAMREAGLKLGSLRNVEVQLTAKSGSRRDVLASMEIIEVGGERAFLYVAIDITERKQVEEQLRQSQKMEAVGLLAGGIAHDFNNLLTGINGYSAAALQDMEPSHPLYNHLREILKSGERAATLTRQLLAYSRKQVMEPQPWDLNHIIRELMGMLRRMIGEDVTLATQLDSSVGKVRVDRGQLEQIILNLAVNARDAMPEGGKLTLETSRAMLEKANEGTHFETNAGPHVMFSVSDTGTGMPTEVQARLFEPFFTTKEVGKGTGLGLSVVYGIVKQSGGSVAVRSEPGRGTTFSIFFPELPPGESKAGNGDAQGARADRAAEKETWESYRGEETILVVEDEPMVRKFTRQILESQGYRIIEAGNGIEALKRLEESGAAIQLVITDVVMPDMGGRALVNRIKDLLPGLPILFVTGYSDRQFRRSGGVEMGEQFLEKPFSPMTLARKVREILGKVVKEKDGRNLRP